MGQAIAASIAERPDLALAGMWARGGDLEEIVAAADVVIDFSLPEGTGEVVAASVRHNKPLVCGVSGLSDAQLDALQAASRTIAVVYDRNMSLGIAVLEHSVREAAQSLGLDFDVQISETHHVHKKDAPSGTALKLGEAIAEARGQSNTDSVRFEVERRGEVPGDHDVVMSSPTERLTFSHSVTTRQVFADGALRAARWAVDRDAGLYGMRDVLFA
jgi:4-hydroxy-tetrahydrodipicolinate reductase